MTDTLYDRLGGKDGISVLVDRIMALHLKNPTVGTRFQHSDTERAAALAKEFFATGSGGSGDYTGRSMLDTHAGMNISEQEFIAVVDDMMEAMDELGYDQRERDEVLSIAYSLKGDIIRV